MRSPCDVNTAGYLDLFFHNQPGEMLKRTIISPLCIRRKAASGQLPVLQVVLDTLTTKTLVRASVVAARALAGMLFFPAFHQCVAAS